MPIYKLDVIHGPGHQTHTVEYRWNRNKLKTEDDKAGLFDDRIRDMDYPIGTIKEVTTIPRDVKIEKMLYCDKMLITLEEEKKAWMSTRVEKSKKKK